MLCTYILITYCVCIIYYVYSLRSVNVAQNCFIIIFIIFIVVFIHKTSIGYQ